MILFVIHEANRTGAPLVILYLIKWLAKNTDFKIDILALNRGELKEEFINYTENYYEFSFKKTRKNNIYRRVLQKIGISKGRLGTKEELLNILYDKEYHFIYSNTILTIPIANHIKSKIKEAKHIAHIHELEVIIKQLSPNLRQLSKEVDHFIAASDLVKMNLQEKWIIPSDKITRVYECSTVESSLIKAKKDDNVIHIGGAGTVHWRKGSDLFIQVASYVKKIRPELKFIFTWVGSISKNERYIYEEDIRKADLISNVCFLGQTNNPSQIFQEFDIFLMTSREDPFPLVCIEVGMLGKPIICFEGATGSQEIIQLGGGDIVPYLDTKAMALKIIEYVDNPNLLKEKGEINRKEFANFSPDKICPQIYEVIKRIN